MPTSVMPKGVEHPTHPDVLSALQDMPTSVMPKGVEHRGMVLDLEEPEVDAHLCDAERR